MKNLKSNFHNKSKVEQISVEPLGAIYWVWGLEQMVNSQSFNETRSID